MPGLMLATGMPLTFAIGTSLVAVAAFGAATAASYAISGSWIGGSPDCSSSVARPAGSPEQLSARSLATESRCWERSLPAW